MTSLSVKIDFRPSMTNGIKFFSSIYSADGLDDPPLIIGFCVFAIIFHNRFLFIKNDRKFSCQFFNNKNDIFILKNYFRFRNQFFNNKNI